MARGGNWLQAKGLKAFLAVDFGPKACKNVTFLDVFSPISHQIQLSSSRFRPPRQLKGITGKLHPGDEGRHGGDQQHRDGHRREAEEQRSVAQERQDVAQQTSLKKTS